MDCEVTRIRKARLNLREPEMSNPLDAETFNEVMSEIDRALNPPVIKKLTPAEWVEKWNERYEVGDHLFVPNPEKKGWSVSRRTSSEAFIDNDGNAVVNFEGIDIPQSVREIRINNR